MNTYKNDLTYIRQIMERSSTFMSLSGLSGIGAGMFATLGCAAAFYILEMYGINYFEEEPNNFPNRVQVLLGGVATLTLLGAFFSGIFFTIRKSQKLGLPIWTPATKYLLVSLSIPLICGGIFCMILIHHNIIYLVTPCMLLFYGLALTSASKYTQKDIFWLGILEILLGLIAAIYVSYGLIFWGIGFGILHILYGIVMYKKYN